jgi:Uma2 family endonuclease
MLEKLEEYVTAGVPNVWLIDPRKKKVYTFVAHRLEEVLDSQAVADPPNIRLDFDEIFRGL